MRKARIKYRQLTPDTKITFYRLGCSCHKYTNLTKLHDIVLSFGWGALGNYQEKRVEYDLDWQKEAKERGITECSVVAKWPDGDELTLHLDKFIEVYKKGNTNA